MRESIKKYNKWVYSLSKTRYIFIIFVSCIFEALALAVIPSIISENYSYTFIKFLIIFIVVALINFPIHFIRYRKEH